MSATLFSIRPALPADMESVQAIYAHYVRTSTATFEIDAPDVGEMRGRLAEVTGRGFPWLVAEDAGQILGFAYANLYRTREAYRHTVEDSVYVAANGVGGGVGGVLLTKLIEASTLAGSRQMVAVIGDSANAASVALHAKLGFTHIGVLPAVGFKFGRWIDSVLMQRPLGAGGEKPPGR